MRPAPAGNLLAHLAQIPDPRGRQGRRHPLAAMLAAVVCALLCGARGYSPILQWLHALPVSWWHRLGFTRRPPKDHAFRDLLAEISPEAFEGAIRDWLAVVLGAVPTSEELQAVAIDGKTLRGTLTSHQRAVHLLSLFDQRTGCVLSQQRVDEKTNEHKAALELLQTGGAQGSGRHGRRDLLPARRVPGDRRQRRRLLRGGQGEPTDAAREHRGRISGRFFPRRTNNSVKRRWTLRKRRPRNTAAESRAACRPPRACRARSIGPARRRSAV